ncbi:MAG: hypothetical protein IJN54_08535 [Lachnospiraceae bacterium]|nr:hypothetical protein [Lachnospiraceae bacterium]
MIRQKIKAILMTGAIIFSLCACGQNTAKEETSVKFEKDGAVVNTIIEDFDETLYNVEDLKSMVLNEVAAFNSASGDKGISVEKLEVKDGKVTVAMTYANAEKYTEFNDKILFFGTIAQAYEAGLSFDIQLTSTKKDGGQIGKEEILQLRDCEIIILEEPVAVVTPSKILYASSNVEVLSGKSARVTDAEEAAYLIVE